jgi:membrane protein
MPPRIQGRARAVQEWLVRRADVPLGRLALLWFRRYFEASDNSGSAATLFIFLSVGPLLLAVTGVLHAVGGHTNVFARHLIEHHQLTGDTARLVRETFGTASRNALAASVVAVIGFLLWGIGIGQVYQEVYARAWRIRVRTLADQARFTIWFFVLSGLLGVFFIFAGDLKRSGWALTIPAWLAASTAFWLWTPWYLLHRKIGPRALLPGALLSSILIGATTALSPLFLASSLNSDGKHFGAFGVVLALIAWGYTLTTMSLVCGVFSPVWAEWRKGKRRPAVAGEEGETHPEATLSHELE